MRFLKLLLTVVSLLLVVLIGLAFISHNQQEVAVDLLLIPAYQTRLAFWLLGFFVVGGLLGILCSLPALLREKATRVRLERRMQNNSKIVSDYSS